jgi:phosphopantetheinyl transferase
MREFMIEGVAVAIGAIGAASDFLQRTVGGKVALGHLCPHCGAGDHGRPIVLDRPKLSISRSRSGALEATAISTIGTIGIDIESIAKVGDQDRAFDWVAKEALVKATGHGIRIDFREIELERDGAVMTVRGWPADLGLVEPPLIRTFVADADIVGALAIL